MARKKKEKVPVQRIKREDITRHAITATAEGRIEHNYTWIAGALAIVLMVIIVFAVNKATARVQDKTDTYDQKIEALQEKIEEQEERKADLDYRSVYITTKQFAVEFAREKLGLIFEDELVFRPEK